MILSFIPCFAEGQDGLNQIAVLAHFFMLFTNIFIFTMMGWIIIKLILLKLKIKIGNSKTFLLSLLLSILLTAIFQDKFTYLIFDAL